MNAAFQVGLEITFNDRRLFIEKYLGNGAFGTVYQVYDKNNQRKFALKTIQCNTQNTGNFLREVDTLSKAHHEHIVRIIGFSLCFSPIGAFVVILTELCQGGDLNSRLNKPSSVETNLKWLRQMSEALNFLHSRNPAIVHRDLKADNILLTDTISEDLKITDFGLAREYAALKNIGNSGMDMETYYMKSGTGPMHWMAPEFFDKHYTEKADIFSLGGIFHAIFSRDYILWNSKRMYGVFVCGAQGSKVGLGHAMATQSKDVKEEQLSVSFPGSDLLKSLIRTMLECDYHNRPNAMFCIVKANSEDVITKINIICEILPADGVLDFSGSGFGDSGSGRKENSFLVKRPTLVNIDEKFTQNDRQPPFAVDFQTVELLRDFEERWRRTLFSVSVYWGITVSSGYLKEAPGDMYRKRRSLSTLLLPSWSHVADTKKMRSDPDLDRSFKHDRPLLYTWMLYASVFENVGRFGTATLTENMEAPTRKPKQMPRTTQSCRRTSQNRCIKKCNRHYNTYIRISSYSISVWKQETNSKQSLTVDLASASADTGIECDGSIDANINQPFQTTSNDSNKTWVDAASPTNSFQISKQNREHSSLAEPLKECKIDIPLHANDCDELHDKEHGSNDALQEISNEDANARYGVKDVASKSTMENECGNNKNAFNNTDVYQEVPKHEEYDGSDVESESSSIEISDIDSDDDGSLWEVSSLSSLDSFVTTKLLVSSRMIFRHHVGTSILRTASTTKRSPSVAIR
eukprot:gene4871-5510_t